MRTYKDYSIEDLRNYFVKLHKQIHWLLIYKEEDFPALDDYFKYLLFRLNGLYEMFPHDYRIIELTVLIESAKVEANKPNYDHTLYRKAILDAHSIVSALEDGVKYE